LTILFINYDKEQIFKIVTFVLTIVEIFP